MRRCTEQGEFNWSPHHHHRWSYRGAVRSQKIRDSDGLLCGLHTHSEPIVQFQVMSSMNGSHHGMSEHHQKFMTRICMNEAELWHETNPTIPYLLRCDTLDRHQVNTTRDHLCSVIFSVLCVVALPANDALHLRFLCGDCFYQPQPPKTLCQESESCLTWLEVESLSCCSTEKQTRHFIYTKLSRSATLRSTSWASHWTVSWFVLSRSAPEGNETHWPYCLLTLSTVTLWACVRWVEGTEWQGNNIRNCCRELKSLCLYLAKCCETFWCDVVTAEWRLWCKCESVGRNRMRATADFWILCKKREDSAKISWKR